MLLNRRNAHKGAQHTRPAGHPTPAQGFASGSLEEDAFAPRLFDQRGMEFMVAQVRAACAVLRALCALRCWALGFRGGVVGLSNGQFAQELCALPLSLS